MKMLDAEYDRCLRLGCGGSHTCCTISDYD